MADKQAIEIKGTTIATLLFRLHTGKIAELTEFLRGKFGRRASFFENEPVVIDFENVSELDDFGALVNLLRQLGFAPVAVKNAPESVAEIAPEMALAVLESDIGTHTVRIEDVIDIPDAKTSNQLADTHTDLIASAAQSVQNHIDEHTLPDVRLPEFSARVIRRPLRSGQQVYAQGRDLIALDLVSFGAEVIADGNVHVYAPLRGRALAGVKGDRNARIYTLAMQAELVAIAGVYRTFEEPLPLSLQNRPVQIFLSDADKIIIEPIGGC